MRAEVERRIEYRLLAHPHAVFDDRVDRAPDRAMRAHGAMHLGLAAHHGLGRLSLAHDVERQLGGDRAGAERDPRLLQEIAPSDRPANHARNTARQPVASWRYAV